MKKLIIIISLFGVFFLLVDCKEKGSNNNPKQNNTNTQIENKLAYSMNEWFKKERI